MTPSPVIWEIIKFSIFNCPSRAPVSLSPKVHIGRLALPLFSQVFSVARETLSLWAII
jgi:hypothetical protein